MIATAVESVNLSALGGDGVLHTIDVKHMPRNYALALATIPLMTVFGNALVMAAVYREKSLQTVTNYLIVSLAVSDFLVAICVMSFAVYFEYNGFIWGLGSTLCNLYIGFDVVCSTASILNLLAISLDRYIAISHPLAYAQYGTNGGRALVSIILVWGVSLAVGLPVFMGANQLDDAKEACEFTNGYFIIVSSLLSFFLPCLAMIILYTVIFRRLRQRERARSLRHYHPSANRQENEKISNALLSGVRIARQMGQHFKDKTDQILLEISFQTSSFPALSSSDADSSSSSDKSNYPRNGSPMRPAPPEEEEEEEGMRQLDPYATYAAEYSDKEGKEEDEALPNGSLMRSFGEDLEDELFPFIDSVCSRSNSKSDITGSRRISSRLKHVKPQSCSMAPLSGLVVTRLDGDCYEEANGVADGVGGGALKPKNGGLLVTSQSVPLGVTLNGCSGAKHAAANGTADGVRAPLSGSVYSHCRLKSQLNCAAKKHFMPLPSDKVQGLDDRASLQTNSPKMRSDESWHDSIRDCRDEIWKRVTGGFRTRPSRQLVKKATKQMKREHKATVTLAIVLAVFLGCWLPFFTLHLSNAICMLNNTDGCVHLIATFFTTWLGYLNSSLNPLIYTVFDQRFRKAFRNILKCSQ